MCEIIEQSDLNTGIVRGGDNETKSVKCDLNYIIDIEVKTTLRTPTEPLPREGEVTEGLSSAPEGY